MSRKFITAILAGSLAITGLSTVQANAGDRDLARFLVGATALVIIGNAIQDDNHRAHRQQVAPPLPPRHSYRDDHGRRDDHRYDRDRRSDRDRNHDRKHHESRSHDYRHPIVPVDPYRAKRDHPHPRPLPERVRRHHLPDSCIHTFRTNQGTIRMYGENCLKRNYRQTSELPRSCVQRLWTRNGAVRGFNPTCLRRNNWLDRG